MGKPTTLPGVIGLLASNLGVAQLADAINTSPRNLHRWAHNDCAMPGIEAGLIADLCRQHGVKPMLYTHPNLPIGYVASTPEGWVMWTWGLPPNGYAKRTRYLGHLVGLVPAPPDILLCARTHGWPW